MCVTLHLNKSYMSMFQRYVYLNLFIVTGILFWFFLLPPFVHSWLQGGSCLFIGKRDEQ